MLLESLKDHRTVAAVLPNIFFIVEKLTTTEFTEKVLPSLKPLFSLREVSATSTAVMLDKLHLLISKTPAALYKEGKQTLVYFRDIAFIVQCS